MRSDDESMRAYLALNTRYYAGRMIQCQFVNIPSWTAAICGESPRVNGYAFCRRHRFISRFIPTWKVP